MRNRTVWFAVIVLSMLLLAATFASADTLYENGPENGQTDAWTINFGFWLSNSFTISSGPSEAAGVSFWVWITPGDTVESVEATLSSGVDGQGTVYFDGTVGLTQSNCFLNSYSFEVCQETGTFSPTGLTNGNYWLTLQNAQDALGDPVYWDENNGAGCNSPGCPSEGVNNSLGGSVPSEAFTILGTAGTNGTVPEPGSLLLLASGFVGGIAWLRRLGRR